MRQAGRSLPAYRELRKAHGNIKEIAKHPELLAEITLLPLQEMEVDAAIMFADIMLPLAGLGVEFELVDEVGPVVTEPISTRSQIEQMTSIPAGEAIPQVMEAIKIVVKELDGAVPLIGFSGAPFTLASYLVEGRPSRDYAKSKALMFAEPETWHLLMEKLTDMAAEYLNEQVASGVQAVQLFDSWAGALSPADYKRYVLSHSSLIFEQLSASGVPRIHFGTGTATLLSLMASVDCEVVGVDWRIPLDAAWERIGPGRAIQGNLDPAVLLGPMELIKQRAVSVLEQAGSRPGHIFNLGHGVLPAAPLENLRYLVDVVHEHSLEPA